MAVYFTIIFPKYSKALLKRKYEEYKEINYESLFQDIKEKAI